MRPGLLLKNASGRPFQTFCMPPAGAYEIKSLASYISLLLPEHTREETKLYFTLRTRGCAYAKVWGKEGLGVRGKGRKEPFSKGFSSPSPGRRRRIFLVMRAGWW
jgi:hypothetical protein